MHFVRRDYVYFYDRGIVCYKCTPVSIKKVIKSESISKKYLSINRKIIKSNGDYVSFYNIQDPYITLVSHRPLDLITSFFGKKIQNAFNKGLKLEGNSKVYPSLVEWRNNNLRYILPDFNVKMENKKKITPKNTEKIPENTKSFKVKSKIRSKGSDLDVEDYYFYKCLYRSDEKRAEEIVINKSYLNRRKINSDIYDLDNSYGIQIGNRIEQTVIEDKDRLTESFTSPEYEEQVSIDLPILKPESIGDVQEPRAPRACPVDDIGLSSVPSEKSIESVFLSDKEISSAIESPNLIKSLESFNFELSRLSSSKIAENNSRLFTESILSQNSDNPSEGDKSQPMKKSSTFQSLNNFFQRAFSKSSISSIEGVKEKKNSDLEGLLRELSRSSIEYSNESDIKIVHRMVSQVESDSNNTDERQNYTPVDNSSILDSLILNQGDSCDQFPRPNLSPIFSEDSVEYSVVTDLNSYNGSLQNILSTPSRNDSVYTDTVDETVENFNEDVESGDELREYRIAEDYQDNKLEYNYYKSPTVEEEPSEHNSQIGIIQEEEPKEDPKTEENESEVVGVNQEEIHGDKSESESIKEEKVDQKPFEEEVSQETEDVIRPLKDIRNNVLTKGFKATVYIINANKTATSSLCNITFNYDEDSLVIKSPDNTFEIKAEGLSSEEIPTSPGSPILLKITLEGNTSSAIVIQTYVAKNLEVLAGTIGWVNASKLSKVKGLTESGNDPKDKGKSKRINIRRSLFAGLKRKVVGLVDIFFRRKVRRKIQMPNPKVWKKNKGIKNKLI